MKIIIIGADQTGTSLSEYLVADSQNDITVIDENSDLLSPLQERFDLKVVEGRGSFPHILQEAGAEDADMVVAVTNSDEQNLLACFVAEHCFNVQKKVARIRAPAYNDEKYSLYTGDKALPIDRIISPEKIITENVNELIHYMGSEQIASFHNKNLYLVAATAYYGGTLVGCELVELKEHLPYVDVKIMAIYRQNRLIRPLPSTIIEAGDLVYFLTIPASIKAIIGELQRLDKPCKRIMIIGSGNIAIRLAKLLETTYQVKLIERNPAKAELVAEQLSNTIVLNGEASDQKLLSQEQVDLVDIFIAVTSDDESNIMSSMLAKKMGAKKVIVLIQQQAYLQLINQSVIDIAVSPKTATISELLSYVRQSHIVKVVPLKQSSAEIIEIVIKSETDEPLKIIGKSIEEIKFPSSVIVGAIIRENEIIIAEKTLIIENGDHLIMFIPDNKAITEIEKLLK